MLELAVLGLLLESPMHGYELRKRLTGLLGARDQWLDIDANATLREPRGHHPHPISSRDPKISETLLEVGPACAAAVVREHVDRAASVWLVARDLDAAEHASARDRDARACARIVIGECEHLDRTRFGSGGDVLGTLGSVGARRMAMQLEAHSAQRSRVERPRDV